MRRGRISNIETLTRPPGRSSLLSGWTASPPLFWLLWKVSIPIPPLLFLDFRGHVLVVGGLLSLLIAVYFYLRPLFPVGDFDLPTGDPLWLAPVCGLAIGLQRLLGPETMENWQWYMKNHLLIYPGVQEWWALKKLLYPPVVREWIDTEIERADCNGDFYGLLGKA